MAHIHSLSELLPSMECVQEWRMGATSSSSSSSSIAALRSPPPIVLKQLSFRLSFVTADIKQCCIFPRRRGFRALRRAEIGGRLHPLVCSGRCQWSRDRRERVEVGVVEAGPECLSGLGITEVIDINNEEAFVEVGYISSTHGLNGELKVTSSTDFPEERFEKPGPRWVRARQMDKVKVCQVELIKGRSYQGKKPSWLVSFRGIDTCEKASEFVGSTLLVRSRDRPILEEDDFYIPDLVGMSVVLQCSGKVIGEVVDIFNSGASDLLHVKMVSCSESDNAAQKLGRMESVIWIPFVKDIVPTVDKNKRIVEIAPPEGLLELNSHSGKLAKKLLRRQAFREKRKQQEKIGGMKKRLFALKQISLLSVLASSDKFQKEALIEQLMSTDFKLFQHALEDACMASERATVETLLSPLLSLHHVNWEGLKNWLENPATNQNVDGKVNEGTWNWWTAGLELIAESRVAVVAIPSRDQTKDEMDLISFKSNFKHQAEQLLFIQKLAEMSASNRKPQIPWIVVTTDLSEELIKTLFRNEDFFGLDEMQVTFLKQSCLPYVSRHATEGHYDIFMETPWRIAIGSGGEGQIFGDLASAGVLDSLIERGACYIQIYAADNALAKVADPVFFGFTHEKQANIGMKIGTGPICSREESILCLQQVLSNTNIIYGKSSNSKGHMSGHLRYYLVMNYEDLPSEALSSLHGQPGSELLLKNSMMLSRSEQMISECCVIYRVSKFFDYVYSVKHVQYVSDQRYKLHYNAVLKKVPFVQKVGENLEQIAPEEYNALQLKCSIHSALAFCQPEQVAFLEDN